MIAHPRTHTPLLQTVGGAGARSGGTGEAKEDGRERRERARQTDRGERDEMARALDRARVHHTTRCSPPPPFFAPPLSLPPPFY